MPRVLTPIVSYLRANWLPLLIRQLPFLCFALFVGTELIFSASPLAKAGIGLVVLSTVTVTLDVAGKLPPLRPQ